MKQQRIHLGWHSAVVSGSWNAFTSRLTLLTGPGVNFDPGGM